MDIDISEKNSNTVALCISFTTKTIAYHSIAEHEM